MPGLPSFEAPANALRFPDQGQRRHWGNVSRALGAVGFASLGLATAMTAVNIALDLDLGTSQSALPFPALREQLASQGHQLQIVRDGQALHPRSLLTECNLTLQSSYARTNAQGEVAAQVEEYLATSLEESPTNSVGPSITLVLVRATAALSASSSAHNQELAGAVIGGPLAPEGVVFPASVSIMFNQNSNTASAGRRDTNGNWVLRASSIERL